MRNSKNHIPVAPNKKRQSHQWLQKLLQPPNLILACMSVQLLKGW